MENASKALLIAGAILVVILIIAVGMIVYNSSRGTIDEAVSQMSAQEVSMYNSQFTTYEGDRANASQVRSLLDVIQTNNKKNTNTTAKTVKITFSDAKTGDNFSKTTETDAVKAKVISGKFYTISCSDDEPADGLISLVTITAKN